MKDTIIGEKRSLGVRIGKDKSRAQVRERNHGCERNLIGKANREGGRKKIQHHDGKNHAGDNYS